MSLFDRSEITIGSSHTCDIVVDDDSIRAVHCRLTRLGGQWVLRPEQGRLGVQHPIDEPIRWTTSEVPFDTRTRVWLSETIRLPGEWFAIGKRVLSVGRASDCDVRIEHASVSGRHAELVLADFVAEGSDAKYAGHCLLVDCNSTNGLFLDSSCTVPVSAVVLQPGRRVFLGSHPVDTDSVLHAVTSWSDSGTRRIFDAEVDSANPADASPMKVWSAVMLGVGCTLSVFLLVFFFYFSPQTENSGLATEGPTRIPESVSSFETLAASQNSPAAPSTDRRESIQPPDPEADIPVTEEPSTEALETDTFVRSIDHSLYWIVVEQKETKALFRLGSGVAISDDRIVTSASVLLAAEGLGEEGFSEPLVCRVLGGPLISAKWYGVWETFVRRTEQAKMLSEGHPSQAKPGEKDSSPEPDVAQYAWAAATACDVGCLYVDRPLGHSGTLDPTVSLHPGASVLLLDSGFDGGDPLLVRDDAEASGMPDRSRIRVKELGPRSDECLGVVVAQESRKLEASTNRIGCPVLYRKKMIGLIVDQWESDEGVSYDIVPSANVQKALAEIESTRASESTRETKP